MHFERLELNTPSRCALVDITALVKDSVARSGIANGLVLVTIPHTTAGVTINEGADPSVAHDILAALDRLVPPSGHYTHAEGNSPAHVKATLVGSSITLPVRDGKPLLGTWQAIFFCEFDGQRSRQVHVTVIQP